MHITGSGESQPGLMMNCYFLRPPIPRFGPLRVRAFVRVR